MLYEKVIEVQERVVLSQMKCELQHHHEIAEGVTGEQVLQTVSLYEHLYSFNANYEETSNYRWKYGNLSMRQN